VGETSRGNVLGRGNVLDSTGPRHFQFELITYNKKYEAVD
jgi:hypothetical protein